MIVATYEDGDNKHQIVKLGDFYINRYYVKGNKARRTTKGVTTLPTAVMALMKRFPQAEEIK